MEGDGDPHQTNSHSVYRSAIGSDISDGSLNFDNFVNGNVINGENAHSTAMNTSQYETAMNGNSSYETALAGGLKSYNATAHSLERQILNAYEGEARRAQLGYTDAARGRVHEELAPPQSHSEKRDERREIQ